MKYTLAMTALVLSLIGVTAASAQTYRDYRMFQHGYGPCTTDEGYGRFTSCDSNSGGGS